LCLPHPPQVSLAWLLAQKPWIVPILVPAARGAWRSIAAADLELMPDGLAEIGSAAARIQVQGDRYLPAEQPEQARLPARARAEPLRAGQYGV